MIAPTYSNVFVRLIYNTCEEHRQGDDNTPWGLRDCFIDIST